jgi:predicted transcriptional regulator
MGMTITKLQIADIKLLKGEVPTSEEYAESIRAHRKEYHKSQVQLALAGFAGLLFAVVVLIYFVLKG